MINKTIVVTGASKGIGKEIVLLLAAEGKKYDYCFIERPGFNAAELRSPTERAFLFI